MFFKQERNPKCATDVRHTVNAFAYALMAPIVVLCLTAIIYYHCNYNKQKYAEFVRKIFIFGSWVFVVEKIFTLLGCGIWFYVA